MRWRRGGRSQDSGAPAVAPVVDGVPVVAGYADLVAIGRGATSTVYRARQDDYDRLVALKVLHVDVSDRRAQRRFGRERQLNGRLSHHPNVVTVLDSGFVDGRYPFLAMELFEPGSLSDRLGARGPFEVSTALHVGVRIAGALATAHGLGILHRDVKPQNVLLSRYGEPALADFGIAALLEMEHSMTAGLTPVHAAPEILEGAEPSPAADVYALGSTVYTVLAGTAPFAGPPDEGMLAQLLRITTSDLPALPRTDVPASFVDALRRAMAKTPLERPPSAAALGAELQAIQAELGLAVTTLPVEDVEELAVDAGPVQIQGPAATPSAPTDDTIDRVPATPLVVTPPVATPPAPPTPLAPPAPTAARPAAPVPPIADDGSSTLVGRLSAPAPPVEPERRRRWPLVVAGLAAAGGTAVVVAQLIGDESATGETTTSVAPTPATDPSTESVASTGTSDGSPTTPPPSVTTSSAALAPTDVRVSFPEDQVVVAWRDRTDGAAQHLVVVRIAGETESRVLAPVAAGTSSTPVPDLAVDTPACFQVRAVLAITDDGARTADADWSCINGATITDAPPPPTST